MMWKRQNSYDSGTSFSQSALFMVLAIMMTVCFGLCAARAQGQNAAPDTEHKAPAIDPQELPTTYPHAPYEVRLHLRGESVPPLQWTVGSGTLPPGIRLEEGNTLRGEAERAGEFRFVIVAKDSNNPRQVVQHEFTLKVVEAITMEWKVPAHVNTSRIEGSVKVTNSTPEDMDLTFDVKAVADNGRATEIGYQHFPLKRGTIGMVIPFGENLPDGAYKIYADLNAEVAARNAIYKQELQTPKPLQVQVGP